MIRPLLAILQADLRERLRSPRLWWLLAGMAAATVWALPSASADYLALTVGEHWRGRWSSASIALWGLALGAACRNARPFELALLLATYLSLQGAPVLDAPAAPAVTALGHGLALPLAIALLAAAWRPLIAVSR